MLLIDTTLMGAVAISAASDVRYGKIYNVVTYPVALLGVLLNSLSAGGVGLQASLTGFAVGFVPFFLLFLLGLMNGGDVKLLAAIGALKGFPFILHVIFLSFLIAAFWALAKIIWSGQALHTLRQVYRILFTLVTPGLVMERPTGSGTIPFGVAAAIGSLWALAAIEWKLSFLVF